MMTETPVMVMSPEGAALFVGDFRAACELVWCKPAAERASLVIWTDELTYTAPDIEALSEDREAR